MKRFCSVFASNPSRKIGITSSAIRPARARASSGVKSRHFNPAAFTAPGVELLQSWVALPESDEEIEPAFEHVPVARLPEVEVAKLESL